MKPTVLLQIGVAFAVLGMALVFLGVISGRLFVPGLYVLTAGLLAAAGAGIWAVVRNEH